MVTTRDRGLIEKRQSMIAALDLFHLNSDSTEIKASAGTYQLASCMPTFANVSKICMVHRPKAVIGL